MNIKYTICVLGAAGLFFGAAQIYTCGQSATCSVKALNIDAGENVLSNNGVAISGPIRGTQTFTIFTGSVLAPPPPPPPRRSH